MTPIHQWLPLEPHHKHSKHCRHLSSLISMEWTDDQTIRKKVKIRSRSNLSPQTYFHQRIYKVSNRKYKSIWTFAVPALESQNWYQYWPSLIPQKFDMPIHLHKFIQRVLLTLFTYPHIHGRIPHLRISWHCHILQRRHNLVEIL